MSYDITVEGGKSKRLLTAGKYCESDIVVTATGGGGTTIRNQDKSITKNGIYTADAGYTGLGTVTVEVDGGSAGGDEWFNDGDTHIWITLQEGRTSPMLGVCPKGTVTVDWGDGTTPDVLTGTSISAVKWTPNHEYAKPGDYVITLTVDGSVGFAGSGSSSQYSYLLRYSSNADGRNQVYQNTVQKIEMGSGVTSIGLYAFQYCYSLASIVIPDGVTSIGSNSFNSCYSLTSIVIPDSVTSIGTSAFRYCYSLASIVIPDSVTSIGTYAFQYCYSLASIVIPDGVTSIGSNAFNGCSGIRYFDFTKHTAVPALSNTNAFINIPADCEIRVPAALAEEWRAATNWSTYASQIFGVDIDDGGGNGGAE